MSEEQRVLTQSWEPTSEQLTETDRPEKSDSESNGITIINDTSSSVWVMAANHILGPSSCGFINPDRSLVLPVSFAWWDVYVLHTGGGSGLEIEFKPLMRWHYHRSRGMVGYRETLRVTQI